MKNTRLIISLLFLVFLFLPLSKCSESPSDLPTVESEQSAELEVSDPVNFVPIESLEDGLDSAIFTIGSFLLPLITCLLRPATYRGQLTLNLLQLAAVSWFGYLLYEWIYSEGRDPLPAGHAVSLLAVVFMLLSIVALLNLIRSRAPRGKLQDAD